MATVTIVKEKIIALDQASFQILCDAYLSKEGYPNIVSLGTKAGAQKTTSGTPDTYFFTDEKKYVFVEYTTQQRGLVKKIEEDLEKCLDEKKTGISVADISEIIYCHTSSNIAPRSDKKLRDKCQKRGIKLTIIGVDILAEQLCGKYPKLVKDHLGLSIDTEQIQSSEDFISQYNAKGLAAPLDTPFLFREKEFSEIESAFENKNIVVLTGSAGVGKTRMALEFAKKHAEQFKETVFCIHDRALSMNEDLCAYLEKPAAYFLVVDDANQISNLEIIVDYVNKRDSGYSVKIIITARDYAVEKVKYSVGKVATYETINVQPFSDEQIKELVRTSLGIVNDDYLDRIVRISEGNSRMAILAGIMARQKNRLDSINNATQLYEEYYGRVLQDSALKNNPQLLISAGIMAFLNTIHLDRLEPLENFFFNNGLCIESFSKLINDLCALEIVDIYHDKAVRVSEQCFSNFILKYVFCDKKLLSLSSIIEACFNSYQSRVIHSIDTILNVFRDKKVHAFVESEIKKLWKKFSDENSANFLEFLKVFYGVDPTETLVLLNDAIETIEAIDVSPELIDTKKGKNYQSVDDDILTILGGFANSDDLDCALDLFFKYYLKRPNKYIQFYHTINIYFNINIDSWRYEYKTQTKLIEKFIQYSDNWKNKEVLLLFSEIAPLLLSLHFSPSEMIARSNSVRIYDIFLTDAKGVFEYRSLIWEQLLLIGQDNEDLVKNLLYEYGKSYKESCYDVIKADFCFIEKLIDTMFSYESLCDCIILQHIRSTFEEASIQTDVFDVYENSEKMNLYQLLFGPKRSEELKYRDREEEKERRIKKHIDTATNKEICFTKLFTICKEATEFEHVNRYEICNGLDIALKHIQNNKDIFVSVISFAIENNYTEYLNPRVIVKNLFSLISPNAILEMLKMLKSKGEKNVWEFAFYSEIPEEYIDSSMLEGLYAFLSSKNDSDILSSSWRDITVLTKYKKIDADVFIKSVKIVFAKKEYSEFMVRMYLELLFNRYHISSDEVLSLFDKHTDLLEDLYIWLEEQNKNDDYDGMFLLKICQNNPDFLNKYVVALQSFSKSFHLDERFRKCRVFFQSDAYVEIFDNIIDTLITVCTFPIREVSDVIECFIIKTQGEEDRIEKSTLWLMHYIECNALIKTKMQCVFEALTKTDTERRLALINQFLKCNNDFEMFKSLPLTPSQYSWSGSAVPVYSSWIEFLQKLLPLFTGIKFINHKKYIQDMIEQNKQRIVNAEISEILEK